MAKGWNDLTVEEKFGSARRDLARLLKAYQDLDERTAGVARQLGRIETQVMTVAKEVEELKARLSTTPRV